MRIIAATFALVALLSLFSGACAAVDETLVPGAKGEPVVNEVVTRLIPKVFPFDYGFLRRLAIGGSSFGNNPPTPPPETTPPPTTPPPEPTDPPTQPPSEEDPPLRHPRFAHILVADPLAEPVIWPLTRAQFEATQTNPDPQMEALRRDVHTHLNIDWVNGVTYEADGARPLHSAIATVLHAYSIQYALEEPEDTLPMLLKDQIEFWATHLVGSADEEEKQAFADAVAAAEAKDEVLCNTQLDVVFLFDISTKTDDFIPSRDKVQSLVLKYIQGNEAATGTVRFGLATYNEKGVEEPKEVLPLTASYDTTQLSALFNGITPPMGSVGNGDMGRGLQKAIAMHGARNGIPEVIVMVTHGFRADFQDPVIDAALADAESKGIRVIILGLEGWDHAESDGLLELVPPHFFIKHHETEPVDVVDLMTRAIHAGSCSTDRAPEELQSSDSPQKAEFKAGEIKAWSKALNAETLGFTLTVPEPGLELQGWWCYNNNCERPSEAVHDFKLLIAQTNTITPMAGASKVIFAIRAVREGTISLTVTDIPKPTDPPTTVSPPTSPTTPTTPTTPSTAPTGSSSSSSSSGSESTDSSDGPGTPPGTGSTATPPTGSTEFPPTQWTEIWFSSTPSGSEKVTIGGPVLVFISTLVLWFRF